MRVPIGLERLFGADAVASTKGPYWKIRQFAGFSFSAEKTYSYTAIVKNLTAKVIEVTISFGFSSEDATVQATQLVPAGATAAIFLPAPQEGKSFVVTTSGYIALSEFVGHQIASDKVSIGGSVELPSARLKQFTTSLVGDLAAGTSTQVLLSAADVKFVTLAASSQYQLSHASGAYLLRGSCTLLLDDATLQDFWLLFPAPTNFSLSCKFFCNRDSQWVPPTGMPIWVV